MTAVEKPVPLSVEDYLAFEEHAESKHEYLGGEVHAMAGASARHNMIAGNVFAMLHATLRRGPCRAFMADLKLRVEAGDTCFYYPDVMVACRPEDDHRLYREQPAVVVEVLSEATERIDRREKLLAYRTIEALRHYVLIDQAKVEVTAYHRGEDGSWRTEKLTSLDETLGLPAIGASLPLGEIYERTGLEG